MAITGTKAFTSGEILTANDVNQYLMRGVKVFSSTAVRDAAYGGAGEPTLEEGETCYITATDELQTYDGSAWVRYARTTDSGLELIKTQAIGTAVSTITVSDAFSADYENYRIIVSGGTASADSTFQFTLGSTATGYYWGMSAFTYAGAATGQGGNNSTNILYLANHSSNGLIGDFCVYQPFLAKPTSVAGQTTRLVTNQFAGYVGGWVNNTTSYTAFTLVPGTGTVTGGIIRVYGIRD